MNTYEKIKKDMVWFCIVFILFQCIWNIVPIGRDTTDGKKRSGMALRIDNMTGCHYLEGSKGGITPRLDGQGNHVCR